MLRKFGNSLQALAANTVYVKVFPNRFEIKHIESGNLQMEVSGEPFTTERLLVGNFTAASDALKRGMKRLYQKKVFAPSLVVVIQPMQKTEKGLSEVEERVFRELAADAGARKVFVWVGHNLLDTEVSQMAKRA